MAEFGVKATELSAPQGAGSSPLSPVKEDQSGFLETIAKGVNIFAKGLGIKQEEDAKAQKNAIVSGYVRKQQGINDAVRTGSLSASEAAVRSRALFGEYAAGHSEYIDDFDKAAKALRGFTELGEVEKAVDQDQALFQSARTAAQTAGYTFYPFMTREQQQAQIDAHQSQVKLEQEMSKMYRQNEEARASGRFNAEVAARNMKETSVRLLGEVADANINATYNVVRSLSTAVATGKMSKEEAELQWQQKIGQIENQLVAVAGVNPELASPYRSLFGDLFNTGKAMLDPANANKALENQVTAILNKSKLLLLQQPNVANAVASSQLLGANSELALRSSSTFTAALANLARTSVDAPGAKPQVFGNPEIEKDTFNFMRESVKKLNEGGYEDNKAAAQEAKNAVDNVLQQIGDSLGKRGTNATMYKEAAAFFASPEFGKYATTAGLDAEALDAAKTAFQLGYQKDVIGAIQRDIKRVITVQDRYAGQSALDTARATKEAGKPVQGSTKVPETTLAVDPKNIEVAFSGSGVNFRFKNQPKDSMEARLQQNVLRDLKNSQKAITQLVQIGAHMEGTTNYAAFWEKNKGVLLPEFYTGKQGENVPGNTQAPKDLSKEKDAISFARMSPEETARDEARNRTPESIRMLREEIERMRKAGRTDAVRILEDELDKVE